MTSEKRVRNNRMNIEWAYAKECWDALKGGHPVPPVPHYSIWESDDGKPEKIVGRKPITPKRVSCNGVTVYGGED